MVPRAAIARVPIIQFLYGAGFRIQGVGFHAYDKGHDKVYYHRVTNYEDYYKSSCT